MIPRALEAIIKRRTYDFFNQNRVSHACLIYLKNTRLHDFFREFSFFPRDKNFRIYYILRYQAHMRNDNHTLIVLTGAFSALREKSLILQLQLLANI